jgi:hypothetical protein
MFTRLLNQVFRPGPALAEPDPAGNGWLGQEAEIAIWACAGVSRVGRGVFAGMPGTFW